MTKQSGDADGPRQQMTVEIPQRGEAELSGVDVCIHQDIFRTLTALAPKHQSWIDVKKLWQIRKLNLYAVQRSSKKTNLLIDMAAPHWQSLQLLFTPFTATITM